MKIRFMLHGVAAACLPLSAMVCSAQAGNLRAGAAKERKEAEQ